jgi:hypothetical protein
MFHPTETTRRLALVPAVPAPAGTFDRFAALARKLRCGRTHLAAEHLIAGDAVQIEGESLTVESVNRGELVVLRFESVGYTLALAPARMVRVLYAADCCPVAAVEALDAELAGYQADFAAEQAHRRRIAAPSPWLQAS